MGKPRRATAHPRRATARPRRATARPRGSWCLAAVAVLWLAAPGLFAAHADEEDLTVLPETLDGAPPGAMMRQYLLGHAKAAWQRWQEDFGQVQSAEQIAAYQKRLRETFIERIGGFPERTPLNPKVIGVLRRDGYRVEKIIFESQPGLYVTAALFLPGASPARPRGARGTSLQPTAYSLQPSPPLRVPGAPLRVPGVLVPCGHAENAKSHDAYQTMGALLALNGMAALVFDPIEQGERMQLLKENGQYLMWGTMAHTMVGAGSILLGRNTARFEIWDGMRGIDYLVSRPEVDPQRIGCTGNSGGGTQTSYLMALEDRIRAAAPSCYLNTVARQLETATGDAEQNIFGQLAWGMDHADFLMMRAPMPILICAATKDFFDINATWVTFRFAKRRYARMGFAERVDLLENDAEHNYGKPQREGVVRWMSRWLLGKNEAITEPPIELFSDEELHCTPKGQVMLLDGARSTYDLNEDYERELSERRRALWEGAEPSELLAKVRTIAGIRPLEALPRPEVEGRGKAGRKGYAVEKLILKPEPGICLPALLFVPQASDARSAALYLHEEGMAAAAGPKGPMAALAGAGVAVLAVDVRGTGETQQKGQRMFGDTIGQDWEDYFAAYVLGRSYVGMRAEDILAAARYLTENREVPDVDLIAEGNVGVPALHAAALEPQLFRSVRLIHCLTSWSDVVRRRPTWNQLINTVHGALTVYDLPDLALSLGGKLAIEEPLDAAGHTCAHEPGQARIKQVLLSGVG